jgi:hypothetical protein
MLFLCFERIERYLSLKKPGGMIVMRKKPAISEAGVWLLIAAVLGCNSGTDNPPVAAGRAPDAGDMVINEFLSDPASDANCDGTAHYAQDEFVELVSVTNDTLDLSDVTLTTGTTIRHVFARHTVLLPGHPLIIFGGGTPSCAFPAGVTVLVAGTGGLGLLNTGVAITLNNGTGTVIDRYDFQPTLPPKNDVSTNLSPDLSGTFQYHDLMTGSIGNYSPGTTASGSSFF